MKKWILQPYIPWHSAMNHANIKSLHFAINLTIHPPPPNSYLVGIRRVGRALACGPGARRRRVAPVGQPLPHLRDLRGGGPARRHRSELDVRMLVLLAGGVGGSCGRQLGRRRWLGKTRAVLQWSRGVRVRRAGCGWHVGRRGGSVGRAGLGLGREGGRALGQLREWRGFTFVGIMSTKYNF